MFRSFKPGEDIKVEYYKILSYLEGVGKVLKNHKLGGQNKYIGVGGKVRIYPTENRVAHKKCIRTEHHSDEEESCENNNDHDKGEFLVVVRLGGSHDVNVYDGFLTPQAEDVGDALVSTLNGPSLLLLLLFDMSVDP